MAIRDWFASDSTVMRSELAESQKQNRALQKMLCDQLKLAAEQNNKLIACLDHVVQSKFDPPVMPKPMAQPENGSLFPPSALADVLSIDDDREFLERTNAA